MPITRVEPGGVFGDVLGGSSLASPVTVLAATACEVLLVPYEQLLLSDAAPPISGCCKIWCAPSATNTSCSPAGWTCWC